MPFDERLFSVNPLTFEVGPFLPLGLHRNIGLNIFIPGDRSDGMLPKVRRNSQVFGEELAFL